MIITPIYVLSSTAVTIDTHGQTDRSLEQFGVATFVRIPADGTHQLGAGVYAVASERPITVSSNPEVHVGAAVGKDPNPRPPPPPPPTRFQGLITNQAAVDQFFSARSAKM